MKLIVLQQREILTLVIGNTRCKMVCSTFANRVALFANPTKAFSPECYLDLNHASFVSQPGESLTLVSTKVAAR